jgi:hypothetical protein
MGADHRLDQRASRREDGQVSALVSGLRGKRAQLKTHECVVCYAESDDGITFTKPNLGLFDFNGEKNTNIVLIGSGVYGDRYCNSVIVDEREKDASKRYKMAFNDWSKDSQWRSVGWIARRLLARWHPLDETPGSTVLPLLLRCQNEAASLRWRESLQ